MNSPLVRHQVPRPPKAITKGEDGENTRVTILYPPDVVERVQALARRQGIAFTALLRQWTIQRLDLEEERHPSRQDVRE
jgi:molybdopterin-guanine dinucleotide biosynthesis protein A